MIEDAERKGLLNPNSVIIEPTSGDMFFIRQDGVEIEVNHETVPELIKAIKAVIKL
jgi:hypothetical protein